MRLKHSLNFDTTQRIVQKIEVAWTPKADVAFLQTKAAVAEATTNTFL